MTTLIEEIQAKCSAALIASRDYDAIAQTVSAGRVRVVTHMLSERGVMAALGVVEGEACLQALDDFAGAVLPEGHPLKQHHAGIKRMLAWLKTEAGIDVGTTLARTLLGTLGQLGILQAAWVVELLALSEQPDPVSAQQINQALVSDGGVWLGG